MRKLDTSSIKGSSVGLPVKAGTLNHIQLAYQEAIAALGKTLAGSAYDPAKVYILNGCINSGAAANYNISAGAIFYNGEVYLVDSVTFTISGANVAVGIVPNPPAVTTGLSFYSDVIADPVQFTDGITRNVHQIRKCVIQPGLSGSGAANYLDWVDLNRRIQGSIGQIVMWVPPGALSTYFNTSSGAGIHPYTIGWQIVNGQGGAIDMRGKMPVGFDPADTDFSNPFNNVGGEKKHVLTIPELPAHHFEYQFPTIVPPGPGLDGTQFSLSSTTAQTNTVGENQPHENMPPYRSVLWVQRMF